MVLRDFVGAGRVSLGMAQGVLAAMQEMGCLERLKKGPASYAKLADSELLLAEWAKWYKFSANTTHSYYTPYADFLKKFKKVLPEDKYALTPSWERGKRRRRLRGRGLGNKQNRESGVGNRGGGKGSSPQRHRGGGGRRREEIKGLLRIIRILCIICV